MRCGFLWCHSRAQLSAGDHHTVILINLSTLVNIYNVQLEISVQSAHQGRQKLKVLDPKQQNLYLPYAMYKTSVLLGKRGTFGFTEASGAQVRLLPLHSLLLHSCTKCMRPRSKGQIAERMTAGSDHAGFLCSLLSLRHIGVAGLKLKHWDNTKMYHFPLFTLIDNPIPTLPNHTY